MPMRTHTDQNEMVAARWLSLASARAAAFYRRESIRLAILSITESAVGALDHLGEHALGVELAKHLFDRPLGIVRHEHCWRRRGLAIEPSVLKCLLGRQALFGVFDEQRRDEVHCALRDGPPLREFPLRLEDGVVCLALRIARERIESEEHDEREQPDTPHVDGLVVSLELPAVCLYKLGCEVLVRAADGAHHFVLLEDPRQAEVYNLDLRVARRIRQQHILWLEVPMHALLGVHVFDRLKDGHDMRLHLVL
mmetsp:Transcript_8913/g.19895  ORF Transcript_8913/g.19895 Transcript_8913/m.19895 type:complete len:252 (+) Transcript_8913:591-1346(+)